MRPPRAPAGGQARHADDWLITYADTITLLLCLFAVLLALHGTRLHDEVPVTALPLVAAPRPLPSPQVPFVVAPFAELAAMPRSTPAGSPADTQDDPDDRTSPPDSPSTRQAPPDTTPSSAAPAWDLSFAAAMPEPAPITPAAPQTVAVAPALAASPLDSTQRDSTQHDDTQRAADDGSAATPPAMAPAPANPRPAGAPDQNGDRITIIQLSSAAFFARGTASLSDAGQSILENLVDGLQSPAFTAYRITVEGHTDDEPISSAQFPSNWELSAARAAAVVRFFVQHGIAADRLRAAGYADTHPLVPNRDAAGDPIPENQARNRRVVIELEKIDHTGI